MRFGHISCAWFVRKLPSSLLSRDFGPSAPPARAGPTGSNEEPPAWGGSWSLFSVGQCSQLPERGEQRPAWGTNRCEVAPIPRCPPAGKDKQKGLLGSQRMEQLFNAEGAQGWVLVAIHEERATFKRLLPD
jgi:hypothetical protein